MNGQKQKMIFKKNLLKTMRRLKLFLYRKALSASFYKIFFMAIAPAVVCYKTFPKTYNVKLENLALYYVIAYVLRKKTFTEMFLEKSHTNYM